MAFTASNLTICHQFQDSIPTSYPIHISNMENKHGQGVSHATDHSKVPGKVQQKAPQGLEESLPDSVCCNEWATRLMQMLILLQVHPTGPEPGQSTNKSHAKGGGAASIVPQKLQEKLPEGVERAVPNAIHDTGDTGGLHRKK